MQSARIRDDEEAALASLRALDVLDSLAEAEFDALVKVASLVCGVPISLISLVDADRQWFKANVGLPGVAQTPRELAFCAHAVLGDTLFEVPDATCDPRFADNPLVAGRPDIRFYAGAPITLSDGARVGTLCVIDRRPRSLDDKQRGVLRLLSIAVAQLLEGRAAIHASERSRRVLAASELALRHSQEFLDRTGNVAGVGGWEFDVRTGAIVWSDVVCRIHGVEDGFHPTLDEAIAFYTPRCRPLIEAAVGGAMEGGNGFDLELDIVRRDGRQRTVRAVGSAEMVDGAPVRLSGAFQDVTERREMSDRLAQQHELLRVTLRSIGDAVITTDAAGLVTWMNPVAERMTGWLAAEAQGRPATLVFRVVDEETRTSVVSPVARCLAGGPVAEPDRQALLVARGGAEFGIEESASPIRSDAGEMLGVVLVFHDVSEQRRLSGEMTWRATHDALTGLVNRPEFTTRLQRTLRHAKETGTANALLCIDLDQFKRVNDACGHAVGDQLLQQMGTLLGAAIRARDTLARLGGDEFALILEHCTLEHARQVAQKICDRMDDFRFIHGELSFRIGASIGLVPLDARWADAAAPMLAADAACYAAKEEGRNRVHEWFDTEASMRQRQLEMQSTARIERALDGDGFVLFAQRLQALRSLGEAPAPRHAELLLRLRNADDTLALPGAFLPVAERFGLAPRIDRWVLGQAIAWLRSASSAAVDVLCVNLSSQSVGDRTFHGWVGEMLARAGPGTCARLCLEIGEGTVVTRPADAALFIGQVRAAGAQVALDDFGAGASSFGYLKMLNVDILKIAGQFVRDVASDPLDDAAVRSFADVARVLGVRTVAKRVDHPDALARVREIGIDFAQGVLVHPPQPLEELLAPRVDHA
jgi:diguanylate cyclase (GGDEF)-like protein/PAS domain S-box-containing protein